MKHALLTLLLFPAFTSHHAAAQGTVSSNPCSDTMQAPGGFNNAACMGATGFSATALIDGTGVSYGDPDGNLVSMYGSYGNNEANSTGNQLPYNHYKQGITQAGNIKALCRNGLAPSGSQCTDQVPSYSPSIVFLFIGFSNCDIEICGGNSDAWDGQGDNSSQTVNGHLPGQPCATGCPNVGNTNTNFPFWWNQVLNGTNGLMGGDNVIQQSFLYQIYQPTPGYLVGPNVVVFNGAFGQQTLPRWDPYDGFYSSGGCSFSRLSEQDAECNYDRVMIDLGDNGFSEAQVQAIFIKAADPYPECDLKRTYCLAGTQPDAYTAEHYLGDILRYLRCCRLDSNGHSTGLSRYPNLQQVFITSRTYGGYANGIHETDGKTPIPGAANCLNPEPFAYEEGFSVQRAIVAQINASPDPYSGDVHFNPTPNQERSAVVRLGTLFVGKRNHPEWGRVVLV